MKEFARQRFWPFLKVKGQTPNSAKSVVKVRSNQLQSDRFGSNQKLKTHNPESIGHQPSPRDEQDSKQKYTSSQGAKVCR
jgi:hypothetical protein